MQQRKLDLKTFLEAMPSDLLQEYIDQKSQGFSQKVIVGDITAEKILVFIDQDPDGMIQGFIYQDLIEINDLCGRSMPILVELAGTHRVPIDDKECCEAFAMRVFLRFRHVFDYAHDRYYFQHCSGKVSDHHISADNIDLSEQKKINFQEACKKHFSDALMGSGCNIHFYQQNNKVMIAIERGGYKRAVSSWKDDQMRDTRMLRYRPAKEDILEYDLSEKRLRIKATNNDRDFYIETFCKDIICDASQIEREDRDKTFDLSQLQRTGFRFELDQDVQLVYLKEVRVKLMDGSKTEVILKSNDVLHSHGNKVTGTWLTAGVIVHAKFLFILKIDGKQKKVSFIITPPNASDLNKKKYASLISSYLERIGFKSNARTSITPVLQSAGAVV